MTEKSWPSFRVLRADEVECRVATCTEKGVSLLLYKDARCDMILLDETVGPTNWQRKHSRDNANCEVSIWDPEKCQWITKEDTGTESNTEAQKGLASDSFKRACFNWGIGRELYTSPFIWITKDNADIYDTGRKDGRGKPVYGCKTRFSVGDMVVSDNHVITYLTIIANGREVFGFGKKAGTKFPVCSVCGGDVVPVKKRDGTLWQPPEIVEYSKHQHGKIMCAACLKKAAKEAKEEKQATLVM